MEKINQDAIDIELQMPNYPKFIKLEMLMKLGYSKEQSYQALMQIWDKIYN